MNDFGGFDRAPPDTVLPQRVGQLFMLDDTFFRSPFMRDKIPHFLFSNGSSGLEPMFSGASSGAHPRDSFFDDGFDAFAPPAFDSNDRRGSTTTLSSVVRHVPIRVEATTRSAQASGDSSDTLPEPDSVSLHSMQVPSAARSFDPATIRRTQSSGRVTPTRFEFETADNSQMYTAPTPPQRRHFPRDTETFRPTPQGFQKLQFEHDREPFRPARQNYDNHPSDNALPPRPSTSLHRPPNAQSETRSTAHRWMPKEMESRFQEPPRGEPLRHTSGNASLRYNDTSGDQSPTILRRTNTTYSVPSSQPLPLTTARRDSEVLPSVGSRPNTPKISRPKSPSLASIREGLKKANILSQCVRRNHGDDDDDSYRRDSYGAVSYGNSRSKSPSLASRRTLVEDEPLDPVEEAIRSLETFDPNEYINAAVSKNSSLRGTRDANKNDAYAERLSARPHSYNCTTENDSDSGGSILMRESGGQVKADSPNSSGIVADMEEGRQRTSGISTISSSSNEVTSPSSSDAEAVPAYGTIIRRPPLNKAVSRTATGRPEPERATISHGVRPPTTPSSGSATPTGSDTPFNRSMENRLADINRASPANRLGVLRQGAGDNRPQRFEERRHPIHAFGGEDAHFRKRLLCSQMTDCCKVIEINAIKMSQFTSLPGWRTPPLLKRSLQSIRATMSIIESALDELVDSTERIYLERSDSKFDELSQLVHPLRTSLSMINFIHKSLDEIQWSWAELARTTARDNANDSLDQFVAILKQLPKDSQKLVQWVYMLGSTDPERPRLGSSSSPSTANRMSQSYHAGDSPQFEEFDNVPTTQRRHIHSDDCQPNAHDLPPISRNQLPVYRERQTFASPQASSQINAAPNRYPPLTMPSAAEIMDGGESTTSSTSSTGAMKEEEESPPPTPSIRTRETPTPVANGNNVVHHRQRSDDDNDSRVVIEEDDLMSVASESVDSSFADYSYPGDQAKGYPKFHAAPPRRTSKSSHAEEMNVSDQEKEALRLYVGQLEDHTATLSRQIEEFFSVVETHQPPEKFVQKIDLITAQAEFLLFIGSKMTSRLPAGALRNEISRATEQLRGLLEKCKKSAAFAKEKYPSVSATEAMLTSIVGVSQAAQNLKVLGKSCM